MGEPLRRVPELQPAPTRQAYVARGQDGTRCGQGRSVPTRRRVYEGDEEASLSAEARLLIDPCQDEPEDYLGYEPTGRIFAIGDAPMGKRSVAVFALFRKALVDERRIVWDDAVRLLRAIRCAERAGVADVAEFLREEFRHRSEQGPYAGVVRFVEKNRDVFLE